MVVTGTLTLLFGSREPSDAWADALQMWWLQVRAAHGHVIPYAAMSETSSNCWKFSVISEASCWEYLDGWQE